MIRAVTNRRAVEPLMKTFIILADITSNYADWQTAFINHQPVREAAGITDLAHGQVEGDSKVGVVLQAESMAVMDAFMAAEAETMAATGHVLESTTITVLA